MAFASFAFCVSVRKDWINTGFFELILNLIFLAATSPVTPASIKRKNAAIAIKLVLVFI